MSHEELAQFLRSRRERLRPADVGLPDTGRRRTPGLRREEVAHLAGVGITWYTWLEQGRPAHPSEQVVRALATALRLAPHEAAHLQRLAGHPVMGDLELAFTPDHQEMLDQLMPLPAVIQTARFDFVAYNRAYRFLIGDLDVPGPGGTNCIGRFFLDPDWRERYHDRESMGADLASRLRASYGAHVDDPDWNAFIEDLARRSPDFARLWDRGEVGRESGRVKRVTHPLVGDLRTRTTNMWLDEVHGNRFMVFVPVDDVTRTRLEQLDRLTAEVSTVRTGTQ